MARLTAAEIAEIQAEIAELQEQKTIAETTIKETAAIDVEEYRFDSGMGSQKAIRRKIKEFTDYIEWLNSRIDYLRRRLKCVNVVNINVRRKGYNQFVRRR